MLRLILIGLPIIALVVSACAIYLRSGANHIGIEQAITKQINVFGRPWCWFGWEVLSIAAFVLGMIFLKKFTVVLLGMGLFALSINAIKYRRAQRRDENFKGVTELFGVSLFAEGRWYSPAVQSLGFLSILLGVALIYAADHRDDALLGAVYAFYLLYAYREQISDAIRAVMSKDKKALQSSGDQPAN